LTLKNKNVVDISLPSIEPAAVRRWVLHICKSAGVTPTELARQAGVVQSTLNRFLNEQEGGQKNLSGTTLQKLRKAAARLLAKAGRSELPKLTSGWVFRLVEIVGQVGAGIWQEGWEWPEPQKYTWPVPVSSRYANLTLVGFEVRGHGFNLVYPVGTILVCVPFTELGRGPVHQERVIVHRYQDKKIEASPKEYCVDEAGVSWLRYSCSLPEHQKPIRYGKHGSTVKNCAITHLIIGSYRPECDSSTPGFPTPREPV
jgi:hypothetical protein